VQLNLLLVLLSFVLFSIVNIANHPRPQGNVNGSQRVEKCTAVGRDASVRVPCRIAVQWWVPWISLVPYPTMISGMFWVHFWSCNVSLYKRSAVRRERLFSPMFCVAWLIFFSITVVSLPSTVFCVQFIWKIYVALDRMHMFNVSGFRSPKRRIVLYRSRRSFSGVYMVQSHGSSLAYSRTSFICLCSHSCGWIPGALFVRSSESFASCTNSPFLSIDLSIIHRLVG